MGASGCSSMTVAWTPRGRLTTAQTAWATPSGRMKLEWRANPQAAHCSMISPVTTGSQSMPIPVMVGPGRRMVARTPVPSSSIWREWT